MTIDAIILAAGQSNRMSINKLYFKLGEFSLINHTIQAFAQNDLVTNILVVTNDKLLKENIISINKPLQFVPGGENRTQSVSNALACSNSDYVLIHDGARPFVSHNLITNIINTTISQDSAVPIIPVTDSIRKVSYDKIVECVNREKYFFVQTPQGFNTQQLKYAYKQIAKHSFTDDSQVYEKFVASPHTINGELQNKKITFDNDILGINAKVGIGYDIHRLKEGIPLVLGGVEISYPKGCIAHSDGDVLIHAIIDALLGLAHQRDIGTQFPNNNKNYKNIASTVLLQKTVALLNREHITINNISTVIIAEKPKLSPYIDRMIAILSNILNLQTAQISINVTTNEEVGTIGTQEAIAAYAICSGF